MKVKRFLAQIALIAVLLFTAAISPNLVQANYGAPEGWRDLPDYYIFKDTHRGGWSDSSGGLETENGNLPVDWDETYEDLPSLRFNVTEPVGIRSLNVLAGWASHDKSNYVPNGHLEFYVKGKEGGEQIMIGGDDLVARRDPVEQVVLVPVSDYVTVTTEWQHVKIPLKDIYDDPDVPLDATHARAILLDIVNDEPFTVWINQLKMTSPDIEPGFPEIKVNQVGFRNLVEKYAYVSGFEDEFTADVGTPFQVRRVSDNTVAYSGELILAKDYDVDSGERVLKAVFTDLEESGDYYITVDAEGIEQSLTFKIGNDVYHSLLVDVARYYLYQRSGMDLEEPFVPDYPRADITPMDTAAPLESDPSRTKDVSKGWFDAGDKGKYITAGASAVTGMLWSYELFLDVYSDQQFNIPESGNGVPDILDESRWELEWILNMQDEESGGFYAKVESMNNNNDTRAIRDIRDGVGNLRPTNDTAFAAAVLAHASLVYAEFDPDFAAQSLEAAKAGWVYLEQNPDNIKGPEHAYATDSDKETRLLAAATLYRVTGESKYHDYFLNNYEQSENRFVDPEGDWVGIYNYAFFQYMESENIDEDALNWYKDHFKIWLDKSIDRYQTNAWNHTLNNGNFYWGSLNQIIGTANEALIGSMLLGTYNETVHNMSLAALNYVLGANPLRKSFVTGHGEDSLQTVYAIMNNDPRPGVPKGFMPLGPNRYNNPGISNFPAKNFMDSATEWTTNEHAVGSTANLVFISAFANSDLTAPTNPLSLEEMVTKFLNDGLITKKGIANSLQSKLSSKQLSAFVNHVKAQRGKHISVEAADQLIEQAEYLLSQQGDQLFRAEEDFVKPIGRTVFYDDTLWIALPGSGAEFKFRGKKAEITLKGDHIASGQTDDYARIGIYANGVRVVDDLLNEPLKTYTVFESASDQDVVIRIVKLSEASPSSAGIHEIRVNAVDGIQPTRALTRKIEILGDSITAGYGVDDVKENGYSTATEDVTKTYAYKTAAALQADYSVVAYGGHGIVSGYTGNGEKNEWILFPNNYDIIARSVGRIDGDLDVNNSPWDFNKFVPDLIVINLGTNDYSYTGDDPVKQAEYRDGYVQFLKEVRSRNENAHLMCTLGIMGDGLFPMVEQAVAAYTNETGDTNISAMKFDVQLWEDGFGAHWHPSEATHTKAADKLIANIKEVMNW